ncbi:fumarylacetoacetate hydrolase family protein [Pendulispora rubella]|uniref:Fumarylacetoacetate hydrolase family protein n=1 Tax=Pendulispora rubella TaxID=2741070 RepID=A0ABZ2L481_9BACT
MTDERAREAAAILWSAWQEKRLLEGLPEHCRPRDLGEGYAVQRALGELAGATIGWKIAATSKAGQAHIRVDAPSAGRLFECFAHASGATLPARHLHMRAAEAEFAFRMGRDLPPRARPYERDEVMAAVGALHIAIEVPDSRFHDYVAAGAAQIVGDDSCAGYFVLGPEVATWKGDDLPGHTVALRKEGAVVATGIGSNVLGDPRLALTWLANELRQRERGLRAGEIVTTGTCIPPYTIGPGDALTADFGTYGTVSVAFEP